MAGLLNQGLFQNSNGLWLAAGILFGVIAALLVKRFLQKERKLTVTSLTVYPIKSCRGIPVTKITLDEIGIKYDRRFMIIDHKGDMVTIRQRRRMVLLHTSFSDDMKYLHVVSICPKAPNLGMLRIPLEATSAEDDVKEEPCAVWGLAGTGTEVSPQASQWLTDFFNADKRDVGPFGEGDPDGPNLPFRLMRLRTPRMPGVANPQPFYAGDEKVSFTDGNQVMITNLASLKKLNEELSAQGVPRVFMDQFRPNIVVDGATAWEEDSWGNFQGPNVVLRRMNPCQRCMVTTVAPNGVASPKSQPLAHLRQTRQPAQFLPADAAKPLGTVPMFGMFFHLLSSPQGPLTVPSVSLGEELTVLSRRFTPSEPPKKGAVAAAAAAAEKEDAKAK